MTIQHAASVTDVAAQCFLNALMRETRDWQIIPAGAAQQYAQLQISLLPSQTLCIDLRFYSLTQHHHYLFPARLHIDGEEESRRLSPEQLVDLLLAKPSIKDRVDEHQLARFRQRVLESHSHTHQAIASRTDWPGLRDKPLNFIDAEQALLVGHAFHPAPKSHQPLTPQQARRYLPEFATGFPLRWFAVDKRYLVGDSLGLTLQQRLHRFAAENAPQLLAYFLDDIWLLPMHPWQAERLLIQPWCQQLVTQQRLRDLGEAGQRWSATSSCRSLYCASSRDMVKFSLSVQLTNSLRTLSLKELQRGMRLARLAHTERWQQLQARFPTLQVMQEDGWAGLCDAEGHLQPESLLALRVNLLFGQPHSQTNVLASLTQAAPDGGDSLLAAAVHRLSARLEISLPQAAYCWLDAWCQQVLMPLFSCEADYGLLLLAHQQNILVVMQQDLPVGMMFRDCQGSGFTAAAGSWLAQIDEASAENSFSEQQRLRYFPYYLIVNSALAVTAALAAARFAEESQLIARVRDILSQLRATVSDPLCLDYVLDSAEWRCKGNFFCSLRGHNENTLIDPAEIYFSLTNPLPGEVSL